MRPTQLAAGVAEAVITPPISAPLLGPVCPATGVHDDLFARALVLSDGARAAAIVCLDLVGMDFALAGEMRAEAARQSGADLVLLCCTHTHSAPFTIPWSLLGRQWLSEGEGLGWRSDLVGSVGRACAEATTRLEPVSLRAGRAPAQAGSNRRVQTAAGTSMAPNPAGVTVPWVDVLCVDRADRTPLAVLFSHAAHPVVVHGSSTLISADFPGYAVAAVKRALGRGVTALYAQSCGANINGPLRAGFGAAESVGEALAAAVLIAAETAHPVPAAPIGLTSIDTELPLRPLPPVEACRRTVQECEEKLSAAEAEGVEQTALFYLRDDVLCARDLLDRAQKGVACGLPFQASALGIGDAWGLAALTHEVFAEYQLWLDDISPWERTMVCAYTNGCESYVPTDAALMEGGYEGASYPTPGAAWRYPYRVALAPGCEERVRSALMQVVVQAAG